MDETRVSLIVRIRDARDSKSWDEFITIYRPLIVSRIRQLHVRSNDEEDVLQEVFLRLARTSPEFVLDKKTGRFRTWLWRITTNAAIDFCRKKRRQADDPGQPLVEQLEEIADEAPSDDWMESCQKRAFEYAVEQTRTNSLATTWACFEQHLLKGRPAQDVADELGMTRNAVYVQSSRVLERVRRLCADFINEDVEN